MTWSMVNSVVPGRPPQYWQVEWSRLKRLRRLNVTVDHVVPRSQGGQTTWENCALACVACNARKANRTPEQASMKLRRVPLRPAWKPLYDASSIRIASWSRFLSDAYWNVPLEDSD